MTTDLYTKTVLTVIAVALSALVLRDAGTVRPAVSQPLPCGADAASPCFVNVVNAVKLDASGAVVPVR